MELPEAFRLVLLEYSREVEFSWFLPEGLELPKPFSEIFCGGCSWSLSRLTEIEAARREWVANVFGDPEDAYDAVWHNKLAFLEVGNGDFFSFDDRGTVIYLSHDDGEGHGFRLGSDFVDFIARWSELGCPGAEDWQLLPFIDGPSGPLQPHSENARACASSSA